jgi:hypothetical protein
MGIHTDERYEEYVVYSVDRAGRLRVTVFGEDVRVRRADLLDVERACTPSSNVPRR